MKKSQNQRVIEYLEKYGYVTRNWAIRSYPAITRLSARIADLEGMGYEFEAYSEHGDYVYKLKRSPVHSNSARDTSYNATNTLNTRQLTLIPL